MPLCFISHLGVFSFSYLSTQGYFLLCPLFRYAIISDPFDLLPICFAGLISPLSSSLFLVWLRASMHCAKMHIFATEFARVWIGTRGVYDNILRYSSTRDTTYSLNILLRVRTVFPNSNRIPWNTMKHSLRHTPDSFSKKINID